MSLRMMAAVCAAGLMCGAPAWAQQHPESELALAREIIELGKAVETMNAMLEAMRPALVQQQRGLGMSAQNAERFVDLYFEEFARELDSIINLSAVAYAERFTEPELTDIRNFMASPSGLAWSAAAPELTAAMSRAGMIFGEEAAQRAAERMRQERESGGQGPS